MRHHRVTCSRCGQNRTREWASSASWIAVYGYEIGPQRKGGLRFSARACASCATALIEAISQRPAVHTEPPVIWCATAFQFGEPRQVIARCYACRGCVEDLRELLDQWRRP